MHRTGAIFLQSALQTGILSGICLLMFFLHYIRIAVRNAKTGILLSVTGFLLMGLANDSNLAVSPLFWCILGMGIAMETETFYS